jgi:hypothetical protein
VGVLAQHQNLEVLGELDPLAAIVFAILVERAELASRGGGTPPRMGL